MIVHSGPEATVRQLTRDDMLTERADLLAAAGLPEAELRSRGAAWQLGARLRGLLSRINGLDFLLAHTPPAETDPRPCGECGDPLARHAGVEGMCLDCTCFGWTGPATATA